MRTCRHGPPQDLYVPRIVVKELADRDADFAAALANQRAFMAQGAHWRTLSRLP